MHTSAQTPVLNQPLTLPCGAVLKNRLMKSAMSDSLGDGQGNPTDLQARLYERWAEGGIALSIIGEVQIDPRFPEKPGNLVLDENANLYQLRKLTQRATIDGSHIWPQLGHAGALAHLPISKPQGPSALDIEGLSCTALSRQDIENLPQKYATAALVAKRAGFTGVQIHAGHGFLLSQFLSPLFNRRTDAYGGDITQRSRLIIDVIDAIRSSVGEAFPIGIKLNSSDQLEGGLTETEALKLIEILDSTSIDLIEISAGTYFPGAKSSSDRLTGGAYYQAFAKTAQARTSVPLVATGGYKSRLDAVNALSEGAVDMVGLARALVLNPMLPNDWLGGTDETPLFPRFTTHVEGGITAWYSMRLTAVASDCEESFDMDLGEAITLYEVRDNRRCEHWRKMLQATSERINI